MENTFTFTARSQEDPEEIATFTLHDDTVSVQLGDALVEQVERFFEAAGDDDNTQRLKALIEPAATGTLQRILQPIDLHDFDASLNGQAFQVIAWFRAGGLRVAPIVATWEVVDNPVGAKAFADEIKKRKEAQSDDSKMLPVFDYWISWIALGLISVLLPLLWWRLLKKKRSD